MVAKAAQERGGLGQTTQVVDAGAGSRLRRAFFGPEGGFAASVAHVSVSKKVRTFGYCCTRVP